jgi:hypothetical protein
MIDYPLRYSEDHIQSPFGRIFPREEEKSGVYIFSASCPLDAFQSVKLPRIKTFI